MKHSNEFSWSEKGSSFDNLLRLSMVGQDKMYASSFYMAWVFVNILADSCNNSGFALNAQVCFPFLY